MEPVKFFIASSGRAIELAKALREFLTTDYSEATIWKEQKAGETSDTIIEMLEEAAKKKFDFAAIILTKDDIVKPGELEETGAGAAEQGKIKPSEKSLHARDNCIFEAGLFMGALGRDRCFLISSVGTEDLPIDLRGIRRFVFEEPGELNNYGKCKEAIKKVPDIDVILDDAKDKGRFSERLRFKTLSLEELALREKTKDKKGDLEPGVVVVNVMQPLETKCDFARQVWENMKSGGVDYRYFFLAEEKNIERICELLQMILLASYLGNDPSFQNRSAKLRKYSTEVLENLRELSINERLQIFFLPIQPGFEFCIHNVGNERFAKAYLRHGEPKDCMFIEYVCGKEAMMIWDYLNKMCRDRSGCIFNWTIFTNPEDPTAKNFQDKLNSKLKKYFEDIHERVKDLCWEGC